MLGFQRRRVRRCENEIELPKPGPLPQTSQVAATGNSYSDVCALTDMNNGRRTGRRSGATAPEYRLFALYPKLQC